MTTPEENAKLLQEVIDLLKEGKTEVTNIGDEGEKSGKKIKFLSKTADDVKDSFAKAVSEVKNIGSAANEAIGIFGSFDLSLQAVISKVLEVNKAFTELSKATGGMSNLRSQVDAVASASRGLGMSIDEMYQTVQVANEAIFGFNELSKKQQAAIGGTINRLQKLGVESNVTAGTINTLNKSLGMTSEEASQTMMDMAAFSRQLGAGMTPGKLAQEFSQALPKLSAYGKGATNEFKKLAAQAKHTGVEINELLGIAGQFDTFEDAAENTAQLNALLGTQLNSVDMLTASEGERLEMLKESFDATGRSFDQLNRFEKQNLATAAGFESVDKAAAFFNASLEDIADTEAAMAKEETAVDKQSKLNNAIQQGVAIQDAFNAKVEALQMKIGSRLFPLVDRFITFLLGPAKKGEKAPIDIAMDMFDKFMTFMENEVIKPFMEFVDTAEGKKFIDDFIIPFMGFVLSVTPIMSGLAAVLLPIATVVGSVVATLVALKTAFTFVGVSIGFLVGTVAPFLLALAAVGLAMYALYAVVKDNWDMIQLYIDENITTILGFFDNLEKKTKNLFVGIGEGIVDGVQAGLDYLRQLFPNFMKEMEEMLDPTEMYNSFFKNIPDFLDDYLPESVLDMKKAAQFNAAQKQAPKYHEGGLMSAMGVLRDDEYVMIPPKNAAPTTVMTPQQMAAASMGASQLVSVLSNQSKGKENSEEMANKLVSKIAEMNDKKPVTVSINIDGRKFVKETVVPAFNKEYNLQGYT